MAKFNFNNISNPNTAYKDMLGINNSKDNEIQEIDMSLLDIIEEQPYSSYDKEQLQILADNIDYIGLLSPLIVKFDKDNMRYIILSGRNRYLACKILNWNKIKCIVMNVEKNKDNIILVSGNLQRSVSIVEKAKSYKLLKESAEKLSDSNTTKYISNITNENKRTIQRYLRLAELIMPILELVNINKMQMSIGIQISYLKKDNQQILYNYINKHNIKINKEQSNKLREIDVLDEEKLHNIFCAIKKKQKTKIKINYKKISKYFRDDITEKEIEDYIIDALENYKVLNDMVANGNLK